MELAEAANIKYTDTLTVGESLEHLKSHQMARFPVGTKFEYSNTGYFLLSQVIEKVSGKSLRQFTKDRIFDPLNMRATTIVDYYPTTISIASGYSKDEQGTYEIYESPWEHTGDGAVHTIVEDLVKRMSKLGSKISPTGEGIIEKEDYAFGLRVREGFNCRYLEYSGRWAGYSSHFIWFPEEYLSVAVLSNYDEFDSKKYANEIAKIVIEK